MVSCPERFKLEFPPLPAGDRNTMLTISALMLTAALAEFAMGRQLWGTSGIPGLWSGDIWSSHNSQFLADPYSFTHITHGVLLYAFFSLAFLAVSLASEDAGYITGQCVLTNGGKYFL